MSNIDKSASRTFSMADQQSFAAFCGDRNPLHMDAVEARRSQAGGPVVHGIHILLWTLETLLISGADLPPLRSISGRFRLPLLVGDNAEIHARRKNEHRVVAEVSVGESAYGKIDFQDNNLLRSTSPALLGDVTAMYPLPTPVECEFGQAHGNSGRWHPVDVDGAVYFPRANAAIGVDRVQAIGFISTLVGMICPGLHSILRSVIIDLDGPQTPWLDCKVVDADERFQRIIHEIAGGGIKARVESFFRPRPVAQPSIAELAGLVQKNEFAGSTVLIVGGSRGLGALTAKLLAAGGAKTLLTYAVGLKDAEEMQREIRGAGGVCEIVKFDVLKDGFVRPPAYSKLTHVYYFATPKIAGGPNYSRGLLDRYLSFYADGLAKLVRGLAESSSDPIRIFNPSSVTINEPMPNLAEYAMAKASGEVLAEYLEQNHKNVRIISYRLPRLLTDQTAGVSPSKMQQAHEVMLPLIRMVQNGSEA